MEFDDIFLEILNEYIKGNKSILEKYINKYPQYKEKILSKIQTAEFIKNNLKEEDLSGKKLGDYIILEELGRGGMGIVFLAIHPGLSRLTAVKVLPPSFVADQEALDNFKNEAKIIAKFNHPNIVPIYSIDSKEGLTYIAMGYVPGLSLQDMKEQLKENKEKELKAIHVRELIEKTKLNKKDISQESITLKRGYDFWNKSYYQFIATLGKEISSALSYAHKNKIIHGDIKPSNIIINNEGLPMILDFGLSRDIKKETEEKDFSGTLAYSPPEQIKENTVNEKTDIWSLGITFYEVLTFINPFKKNTIDKTMKKVVSSNPPPLKSFNKKVPAELEAIIMKCLEKNPQERYSSMEELSNDFNNYLQSKPIKAKPINILKRIHKWTKRHPIVTIFTWLLIFMTSLSLFLSYYAKINQWLDKGSESFASGNFSNAKKHYNKVIDSTVALPPIKSIREKAFIGLSQIYHSSQPKKAFKYYKEILKLNPKSYVALIGTGTHYAMIGDNLKALQYYKRCAELYPGHLTNQYYANLLWRLGKIEKAEKWYELIIDKNPSNIQAIFYYSGFLRDTGQENKALSMLAEKCENRKFANTDFIKVEITKILEKIIVNSQKSPLPLNTYEKVKNLLLSKGFTEKYANEIITMLKVTKRNN